MENVERDKCAHKVDGHMHKNNSTVFTRCCCVGSGEERIVNDREYIKWMDTCTKNKSTYDLLLCRL